MGFWSRLFRKKKYQESGADDWENIVYDRDDVDFGQEEERSRYIANCLEQMGEATKEIGLLTGEYSLITSYLTDMEEIEALPEEEKAALAECAEKIEALEEKQSGYKQRKNRLSDMEYHKIERMEEEIQEGYGKLKKAEEYQEFIKRDLRKLDGEKHAYHFRRSELRRIIADTRSMTIVCTVAVILGIVVLFVLQYGFHINTKLGYLAVAAVGAVAITLIFIKHNDSVKELARVESSISRIIRLQNMVKIRYVNNTHLLDYLYMKYKVKSAGELGKSWELYQQEKEERHKYLQAELQLDEYQQELLHVLRRYQIKDPMIWLQQTQALLDRKEMVEIRHNLIIRRQSLRRRMDYNKEVIAGKAQEEIKDLVESYPKYAGEIMNIVDEYEKDFS